MDEYGFNIKRYTNVRKLFYRKDSNISTFPDYHALNVIIHTLSWYLFTNFDNKWSRCYVAFNYIFDAIIDGMFSIIIVCISYYIIPSAFLVITDEIIKEIAANIFT